VASNSFFSEERTGDMNQARFSTLATAAAALVTHMALTSGAQAKVTEITNKGVTAYENDGVLTEIYELPVDGTSYDVTFDPSGTADGKYFPSLEAAIVASKALENEIESLGLPHPVNRRVPVAPGLVLRNSHASSGQPGCRRIRNQRNSLRRNGNFI
jgi:hypothetical protein